MHVTFFFKSGNSIFVLMQCGCLLP